MRCVKCGNEIPNDSKFCPECGEKTAGRNNINKEISKLSEIGVYIWEKMSSLKQSLLQANVKKKMFAGIGCLIVIFIIIGIVSNSGHLRNENEILKDLQSWEEFFPYCEIDIQQISILQRQTDKNGKSDLIHVNVDGENLELGMNFTMQYELYYYKYNEGWRLDNVVPENYEKWIITEPSKGQVIEDINNELDFLNLNEVTITEPQIIFTNEFSDTAINMKVEFSANGTGETYDLESKGFFTYNLTDSGWKIDKSQSGVDYGNTRLIAHNYVEEDVAKQYLIEQIGNEYSNIELIGENHDLGDNYITYLYSCEKEHQFATVKQQYNITYFFNDKAEWEVYNSGFDENLNEINWHIDTTAERTAHYFDTAGSDQVISYRITYPYNGQKEYAYVITQNTTEDANGEHIEEQVYEVNISDNKLVIKDVSIPYRGFYWLTADRNVGFNYDEITW